MAPDGSEAAVAEQQETSEDALLTRIGQAVMLLHGGDREEARNRFGQIWSEIGESGDAFQRCTLAHYMADTQDDPGDELAWDLRALAAAGGLGQEEAAPPGVPVPGSGGNEPPARGPWAAVRAFYPSLHLNLARDYLKLQRPRAARLHLERARAAADALDDDGQVNGVRGDIERLERKLREDEE